MTKNKKKNVFVIQKMRPPRLEGVQYATGEEQRAITNSSGMNEVAGPKQK